MVFRKPRTPEQAETRKQLQQEAAELRRVYQVDDGQGRRQPTEAQQTAMAKHGVRTLRELEIVQWAIGEGAWATSELFTPTELCWAITMTGVRRNMFKARTGHDWTADESKWQPEISDIRAYFARRATSAASGERPVSASKKEPVEEEEPVSKKSRLRQYLEYFEAPSPNDLSNLETLADLQDIQERLRKQVSSGFTEDERGKPRRITAGEQSDALRMINQLTQQCQNLEKTMGIDRSTRDKRASDQSDPDRWNTIITDAKEFLDTKINRFWHCGILISWVAPTFMFAEIGAYFTYKCPRCGENIAEKVGTELAKEKPPMVVLPPPRS